MKNDKCKKCTGECKQEVYVKIVQCKDFVKKTRKSRNEGTEGSKE
jgi:hypothetical protein